MTCTADFFPGVKVWCKEPGEIHAYIPLSLPSLIQEPIPEEEEEPEPAPPQPQQDDDDEEMEFLTAKPRTPKKEKGKGKDKAKDKNDDAEDFTEEISLLDTHGASPRKKPATPAPAGEKEPEGPKARLVIHKLVLVNFKSYAGQREIGPFHKVILSSSKWKYDSTLISLLS